MLHRTILATAVVAIVSSASSAATIPYSEFESVAASSQDGGLGRYAVNTVNGSGLTGMVHDDGAMGVGTDNTWQTYWQVEGGVDGTYVDGATITYTFKQNYKIDGFHFWNLHSEYYRGVQTADISTWDGVRTTDRGSYTFGSGQAADYTGQEFDLSAAPWSDVKSITLTMRKAQTDGQAQVGFSEIQFSGSIVPEPSAIGLAGTSLVMFLRRRRA